MRFIPCYLGLYRENSISKCHRRLCCDDRTQGRTTAETHRGRKPWAWTGSYLACKVSKPVNYPACVNILTFLHLFGFVITVVATEPELSQGNSPGFSDQFICYDDMFRGFGQNMVIVEAHFLLFTLFISQICSKYHYNRGTFSPQYLQRQSVLCKYS